MTKSRWPAVPVLAACALLAIPRVAPGQAADPKNDFVQALARFSLGLDGAFGDEGTTSLANLETLRRSLDQWDATVRGYETAMRSDLAGADPSLAARLHLALGGVYLDRSRTEDALREFAAAAKLNPTSADVHMLLGLTHRLVDNPDAATQPFRQAAMLEPGNPVRAYVLARHLMTIGEQQEARKALRIVQEYHSARGADGRTAPAAAFLRLGLVPESAGIEPFFPPALYTEGFASLRRGEHARAIAQFSESAARDPLTAPAGPDADAIGRAASAFRNGSVADALEHLEVAVALAPSRAEPHRIRGLVLVADRQYARGAEALSMAVSLNPGDERARLALAEAFVKNEQLSAAERALKETIAELPASGRARYLLGRVYQASESVP